MVWVCEQRTVKKDYRKWKGKAAMSHDGGERYLNEKKEKKKEEGPEDKRAWKKNPQRDEPTQTTFRLHNKKTKGQKKNRGRSCGPPKEEA